MTLQYGSRTLEAPGVLRREFPSGVDIWWPGGPTCVAINGDLDAPRFSAERQNEIQIDGVLLQKLDTNAPDPVEYGQGLVMAPFGWDPPVENLLPDWYLVGGMPLSELHGLDLSQHLGAWGPFPDSRKTTSGGSPRLFTSRVPGAIAAHVELLNGRAPRIRDAVLRVAEQWKRACHLYRLVPAPEAGFSLAWWDVYSDPELLPYQGYSASSGGPSTLYGAVRPAGVTWSSSGWPVDDPDHFAVDQSCLTSALLGWEVAAANAHCVMNTGIATARREESTGGRGNGHLIRGLASFALVDDGAHVFLLLEEQLGRNEDRNVIGPGWAWPFVDRGNSTDAYHMPPSSTQWIADLLGLDASQNRNLARSASSFMVGINALGYDLALRVPAFWGSDLRTRLFAQMELGASHLLRAARAPAVNVDSRRFGGPGDGTMWDDTAPPLYGLKTNRGDGGSKSVAPRFVTPALAAMAGRKDGHDEQELLLAISEIRSAYGNWDSGSRWLEVWPMESV